ncbi:protein of unknown function [Candidatus Methylomirabilis oxygeniifera]|uniref:Uncharacterized protein n=1 Tax=Methylomirabilis oxygeniifera TaxID=671143 RepID=D5MJR6_METO1|nr:protein of unknown function [Candidatus Methylomirabilis oxyfera]
MPSQASYAREGDERASCANLIVGILYGLIVAINIIYDAHIVSIYITNSEVVKPFLTVLCPVIAVQIALADLRLFESIAGIQLH